MTGKIELSDTPSGGTGLLAMFVDLEEKERADFRPWLARDMFPPRLRIGFLAAASYDRVMDDGVGQAAVGPGFVTLYDLPSLGHLYGEPYQALRRRRGSRDAAYHEAFIAPERYTLAWAGPEVSSASGGGFAPYIFIDRFDLAPADAQAFNIWFAGAYLPGVTKIDGLRRVRRYLAMEGAPAHMVVHEFASRAALDGPPWAELRQAREWSLADPAEGAPGLYSRIIHAPISTTLGTEN